MKTTKLIIAAGLLALLSSCSDTVDAGSDSLVQPTGKLSFIVRDNQTSKALQGVKAELLTTGKTATTGADGIVTFEDVYAGQYVIQLAATGYATRRDFDIYTATVSEANGVYIVGNTTETIYMYPTTASLEGTVKYEPKGTTAPYPAAAAAANAWVYIDLGSDDFVNRIDSVQTDASGKYTFTNQPAGASNAYVYLKLFENAGNKYYASASGTSYYKSASLIAGITTYPAELTFVRGSIIEPPTTTP